MKINKQLFEDVLSDKLKGTFILRNGITINSNKLTCTGGSYQAYAFEGIRVIFDCNGRTPVLRYTVVKFIPDTNMKENELTIEIPDGKIVDWDESKKQNKIVLKDKQLTYGDVCRKLFGNQQHYHIIHDGHVEVADFYRCNIEPNAAKTRHQLECILAKNKLANVAKYLNDGWKPINGTSVWIIGYDCYSGYYASSVQVGSIAFNSYGLIVFKSRELAEKAIQILGEEIIKLALEPLGI